MEPLDRYLQSVKKHLPWQRQDDIIAELRANLEAQLEEKESVLGRPLTQPEAEAWIKALGSPLQMAAPYQPQQYLIGPALFPAYRHVLKLACSWGLIVYSIATVASIFAGQNPGGGELLWAFLRLPNILLITAAWVTLIFAAIEFAVTHGYVPAPKCGPFSTGWSPSNLPPFDLQIMGGKKPRSFAQAVAEVVFGVFLLGWLLLIPHHPFLIMGPGAYYLRVSPYQLAPVWEKFYWCIVALNILQLGWHVESLSGGKWTRPQPVKNIAFKAMGLIACVVLLSSPNHALILLKHPALDPTRDGAAMDLINFYAYRGILIVSAIAALQLLWGLGRMGMNAYRKREAAML